MGKPKKGNALLSGPSATPSKPSKSEFASASDVLDSLPNHILVDMLPLLHIRLKQYDETMNATIKRKLITAMLRDLDDPEKCTPGLYQALLRLIGEQLPMGDDLMSGSRIKELEAELPFQ